MHKILVLDDEKNIRVVIRSCLESTDNLIDDAINGEDALLKMQANDYDLLLLDLKLPGMNGMEVLAKTRELYPRMKIVIISAHGSIPIAVKALKEGAADYIEKPFSPQEIRNVVEKVLEQ